MIDIFKRSGVDLLVLFDYICITRPKVLLIKSHLFTISIARACPHDEYKKRHNHSTVNLALSEISSKSAAAQITAL